MESRVVTIARTLAAGSYRIGHLVAEELGFRYVDDEIIIRASVYAGVSPETVGEVERSQPLSARILQAMATISPEGVSQLEGTSAVLFPSRDLYQGLIQWVIQETAAEGQVVIVAHGASIPLANMSGVLRVLITASPKMRAERLMVVDGLDQRQAKKAIQDSDRERRLFFQRFYNLRQELPTHYDLVVNTDRLTVPAAVKLIVTAARG